MIPNAGETTKKPTISPAEKSAIKLERERKTQERRILKTARQNKRERNGKGKYLYLYTC